MHCLVSLVFTLLAVFQLRVSCCVHSHVSYDPDANSAHWDDANPGSSPPPPFSEASVSPFFSDLPPTFSFPLLSYFPSLRPSIPVCLLFLHRPTSLFSTPASCRVIMSFRLCVLPQGKRNIRRSIPVLPRVPGQLVEISCTIVQPDSHSCPQSCLCFFRVPCNFCLPHCPFRRCW